MNKKPELLGFPTHFCQMNFTITSNSTLLGLPFKKIKDIYNYEEKLQTRSECISRWYEMYKGISKIIILSDKMGMQIPYPHELTKAISVLLNTVDSLSELYRLAHDPFDNRFGMMQQTIKLPAPLYYRYDTKEWYSIYSNSKYKEFIPWFRQFKSQPTYPVLNDNLFFYFNKDVR